MSSIDVQGKIVHFNPSLGPNYNVQITTKIQKKQNF